jgi:probable addiction module antidote protein
MMTQQAEAELQRSLNNALARGEVSAVTVEICKAVKKIGVSRVSRATGVDRTNIYKMLSSEGNPKIGPLLKILDVLGLGIEVRLLDADQTGALRSAGDQRERARIASSLPQS